MGIFTKYVLSLIIPAISLTAADAATGTPHGNFDSSRYACKAKKTSSPFESSRMNAIKRANDILEGKNKGLYIINGKKVIIR